jgi:hypothetical protein
MAEEIKCSLCGSKFTCERGVGCWCGGVEATRDAIQLIQAGADDCVCPACLGGRK